MKIESKQMQLMLLKFLEIAYYELALLILWNYSKNIKLQSGMVSVVALATEQIWLFLLVAVASAALLVYGGISINQRKRLWLLRVLQCLLIVYLGTLGVIIGVIGLVILQLPAVVLLFKNNKVSNCLEETFT